MSYVKFLGTAGARVVVAKQLRASGGLWMSLDDANILVDPGPGCLVRCTSSRPKLDPTTLDAILLSHRHLDHSADVNVMIEAMTEGGFKPRGMLLAPEDALEGNDPVVLRYLRRFLDRIQVLQPGATYQLKSVRLRIPDRAQHHGTVMTLGVVFETGRLTLGYISDTRYFQGLSDLFRGSDVLVINMVRLKPDRQDLDHLNLEDVREIIRAAKPKAALLSHFGMTVLRARPWELAKRLQEELGTPVTAASDGLTFALDKFARG